MIVFKTSIQVLRRRWPSLIIYFIVFITLTMLLTAFSAENKNYDFSETKPMITIINRDKETDITKGLSKYLSDHCDSLKLNDTKEDIQDALFFHDTDYVLVIPKGFDDGLRTGEIIELETMSTPNSAMGYRADSLINQYMNTVKTYQKTTDLGDEEIVEKTISDLSVDTQVSVNSYTTGGAVNSMYSSFFGVYSYVIMAQSVICIGILINAFHRREIHMRNQCSPLKPRSMSLQLGLAGLCVGIFTWLILMTVGFSMFGASTMDVRLTALLMLNSFVYMIVCLGFALLASMFASNYNQQNAAANVISLGFSFLGGALVPRELLSEGMKVAALFTPTHWYMTAVDEITNLTGFEYGDMQGIIQPILIQLGFAIAVFSVALVVSKFKQSSEKAYQNDLTEIDD